MNKAEYLKRIDYRDGIDVTDGALARLHERHVYKIPFENLDVYYKKLFDLDIKTIYQKVIIERRGGFCYELNLLFNWLLTELGFSSRIIASRIFNEEGICGPEFDHMSVYVKMEKGYLVDVGYGDLFVKPIEIRSGAQWDGRNYFKIDKWNEHEYLLSMSPNGIDYSKRYTFSLDVVKADDFNAICHDEQTNPDSYFVKNLICTWPTTFGRVTIFNNKLVEKTGLVKAETSIQEPHDLVGQLREHFGIEIGNEGSTSAD